MYQAKAAGRNTLRFFDAQMQTDVSDRVVMEAELGQGAVEIPERLGVLADREKVAIQMGTDKAVFREWLLAM